MLLKQVRGAVGITLFWTVMWCLLGVMVGTWRYLVAGFSDVIVDGHLVRLPAAPMISRIVLTWTIWGAISGLLFAVILSVAERRRSIDQLSSLRLCAWGALGAVALPGAVLVLIAKQVEWGTWMFVPLIAALAIGSVCAGITAAAVRRGAHAHSHERAA